MATPRTERKPRLAYAANRRLGVRGLDLLLERGWEPVALLLAEGRSESHADEMAERLPNVPVLRGQSFRTDDGLARLRSLELDYLLSVHFPYLIPRKVLELPRVGILNLHPAYLPHNRGWHTPSWAILEGTPYGATLHWVSEGVDTGDIALRKPIEVKPDETAHRLYQRVLGLEEDLLSQALPLLESESLPRVAPERGGARHRRAELAAAQALDLDERCPIGEVIDRMRALTTDRWDEAAYFEKDGVRYRIQVEIQEEG